jgi:hypothetical protein
MYFSIKQVEPRDNYLLFLTFENGERRLFDMKPYLDNGIFRELQKLELFNTVHVSFNTVAWANDADFDPEALYEGGLPIAD